MGHLKVTQLEFEDYGLTWIVTKFPSGYCEIEAKDCAHLLLRERAKGNGWVIEYEVLRGEDKELRRLPFTDYRKAMRWAAHLAASEIRARGEHPPRVFQFFQGTERHRPRIFSVS